MVDLGVTLQLLIGPTLPVPAPYDVVDAIRSVEVRSSDRDRDGFQIQLAIGKGSPLDYGLLAGGFFDPPARVVLVVLFNATLAVLFDGVITNHQVSPSPTPGQSTLTITGEDVSLMLDLEERSAVYKNQADSMIVTQRLTAYPTFGFMPQVTQTSDVPAETERVTTQQSTDLGFIRELARKNGFIFYIEPGRAPGTNTVYFGPDARGGEVQNPLLVNAGPASNVDSPLQFTFNALGPASPTVVIVEPNTGIAIPIPVPNLSRPSLVLRPAPALRKTIDRSSANLSASQGALRALSATEESADAVVCTGEVDTLRYGGLLAARRLIRLIGAGAQYDGTYYMKDVRHQIRRGEYKQRFTLVREGLGALL